MGQDLLKCLLNLAIIIIKNGIEFSCLPSTRTDERREFLFAIRRRRVQKHASHGWLKDRGWQGCWVPDPSHIPGQSLRGHEPVLQGTHLTTITTSKAIDEERKQRRGRGGWEAARWKGARVVARRFHETIAWARRKLEQGRADHYLLSRKRRGLIPQLVLPPPD
jgi:hypothetical protein